MKSENWKISQNMYFFDVQITHKYQTCIHGNNWKLLAKKMKYHNSAKITKINIFWDRINNTQESTQCIFTFNLISEIKSLVFVNIIRPKHNVHPIRGTLNNPRRLIGTIVCTNQCVCIIGAIIYIDIVSTCTGFQAEWNYSNLYNWFTTWTLK